MNAIELPNQFGAGLSEEDRLPFIENGVRVGAYTVLGRQPYPTAANRRQIVDLAGPGRIGEGTVVGCLCVIYAGVTIGVEACIGDHAVIREGTRIGDRCVIGTKVDIQYGATIGNDVRILNEAHIAGGTVIGDGSFIGPGVCTANDRRVDLDDYQDRGQMAPVIGKKVFIGVGAILLPGITIGDGAVIGAGALVTKDVPEGETWLGAPAKPIRQTDRGRPVMARDISADLLKLLGIDPDLVGRIVIELDPSDAARITINRYVGDQEVSGVTEAIKRSVA